MFEGLNKHELEQRLRDACRHLGVRYEVTIATDVARVMLVQAAAEAMQALVDRLAEMANAERDRGRLEAAAALEAAAVELRQGVSSAYGG